MTWVRETLERLGVPRRPGGGVPEPIATEEIIRLRDEECLSWAEIRHITGLTEPALLARYRNADTRGRPTRRYNRLGATANDDIRRRNDAINHLDEIRDAYWSGSNLADLAEQWGVSTKTVTRWVYKT
jgi:hypothetical protein